MLLVPLEVGNAISASSNGIRSGEAAQKPLLQRQGICNPLLKSRKGGTMKRFFLLTIMLSLIMWFGILSGQVLEWQGYWAGGYISGIPSDPWLILQPTSSYNFQIIDAGYNTIANFSLPIPANAYSYSVVAASPDFDTDSNIEVLYQYMDSTYYMYRAFLRDITTSTNQLAFSSNDTMYYAYTFYFGNERCIIITGMYNSNTHTWLYRSNNPQNIDETKERTEISNPFLHLYPNPAVKWSEIHFTVCKKGNVTVEMYDITGRKLKTLINAMLPKGEHMVLWHGTDNQNRVMPAGTYHCIVTVDEKQVSKKLTVLR